MATETDTAIVVAYMILFFMQQFLLNTHGDDRAPAMFDGQLNLGENHPKAQHKIMVQTASLDEL
jgi:hypothetical protein